MSTTGSISIRHQGRFFTLVFERRGWLAAEMVAYLGDVLRAPQAETAILKLLGYTLRIGPEAPPRSARHWVEVDLAERVLRTTSLLIRKAVDRAAAAPAEPWDEHSLRRIHGVLDEHDFTVELFR